MDESKDIPGAESEQAGTFSAADIASDWYSGTAAETTDTCRDEQSSGLQDDWQEEAQRQSGSENDAAPEKLREADQSFTLKHLGQVRSVGRDEVIALAQKGLDYDRQRQKNEELMLKNKALSSEGDLNQTRQTDANSAAGNSTPSGGVQSSQETADRRRSAEVRDFVTEYGGVDPKTIPEEVWAAVRSGKQLLHAYQSWELKKLRSEKKASAVTDENREKSAGSRLSAGSTRYHDAITADWYSS